MKVYKVTINPCGWNPRKLEIQTDAGDHPGQSLVQALKDALDWEGWPLEPAGDDGHRLNILIEPTPT